MKIIISALLCLLLVSCNSTQKAASPEPITYQQIETSEPLVAAAPKKTITYDDLNNYTFVIQTNEDTYRVAGDNMKGKRSQLHVSMKNLDVIFELNTKGNSTMFTRNRSSESYTETEIEYTVITLESLRKLLCQIGVDYSKYYKDAKFILQSESAESYEYEMIYKNETYELTIDKETGIWTSISCNGKSLMTVKEFSVTRGIIPNH